MKSGIIPRLLVAIVLTAIGCHASADSDSSIEPEATVADQHTASESISVQIPSLPLSEASMLAIDEDMLATVAREYCAQAGQSASNPAFFLGYLPLWSADQLCNVSSDQASIGKLLGNLFVSGYFGGIWLRDALQAENQSQAAATLLMENAILVNEGTTALTDNNTVLSDIIAAIAWKNARTALTGSDPEVILAARLSIEPFLMIYGYNWGYFNYILTHPPAGAIPPEYYLQCCKRLLDCELPGVTLTTLTRYQPVLDRLYPQSDDSYSSLRWLEMRTDLALWGQGSVQAGAGVWDRIMNDQMPGPVYELLLDLSARFMLIAELCLLPTMQGYADCDGTAARCGLLQEAGMIVWAGSYFMGLASSAPTGTFPQIVIEG